MPSTLAHFPSSPDLPNTLDVFRQMIQIVVDRELVDVQTMQLVQQAALGPRRDLNFRQRLVAAGY